MAALISYINQVDQALSLAATNSVAGYPIANVQTRQLSTVWRGTAGAKITIRLPPDPYANNLYRMVGLFGLNMQQSTVALPGVTLETSADGSTWTSLGSPGAYDNGNPTLPGSVIFASLTFGGFPFITKPYLRITPVWTATSAFFEIGRIWIGDAIVIPDGCDTDWKMTYLDPGALDSSAGGQFYPNLRQRSRQLSMNASNIPSDIAYGFADTDQTVEYGPSFDDLFMRAGSTGEVVVIPRSQTLVWCRRMGIYGHLTSDSLSIAHQAGPYHSLSLTAIEER